MQDAINMWSMYWKRRNRVLLTALLFTLTLGAQERIRCMSYNVENLFDCIDDPHTNDEAFLPQATRHWSLNRYWNKLQAISSVIAMAGDDRAPDFVALCEVENDSVMYDLTRRSSLRTARYEYLTTTSNDPRGIDVALMYKPTTFRPLSYKLLRTPQEQIPDGRHVRDILLVSGELHMGDTIDLLVCHLPSRLNGKQSEKLRHSVVERMCQAIDSISHERTLPHIIVMGDFNDTPHSKSLRPLTEKAGMTCITESLNGSYRYKGLWEQIDHVYLSPTLIHDNDTSALYLAPQGAWNFTPEHLTEPEPRYGGRRPRRTYNGMHYEGGTSDHLPVCFDLWFHW